MAGLLLLPKGRVPYARLVTGGVSMFSESMSILSVGPSSSPPREERRPVARPVEVFRAPGWIGGRAVSICSASPGLIWMDAMVPASSLVSKPLMSFSWSFDRRVLGV